MRTQSLIELLAHRVAPVPRDAARRRIGIALGCALPLSFVLMLALFGMRRDLPQMAGLPMFWIKLLFPIAVAAAGFQAAQRLARPAVRAHGAWLALIAIVLAVWAFGLWQWNSAPVAARPALLWGLTWRSCPFSIAGLAAPVFVAGLLALRDLAPTHTALAGAAVGALAGGTGAAIYGLHCPELGAPFLAVWYVAGITLPVLLGAALGPRLLRW